MSAGSWLLIFEWRDGRVLKVLRASGSNAGLTFEITALDAARTAGVSVPRTYGEVVIDGRTGLVMERLKGTDLLTIIGQKPWLVFHSGRLTGEIHARINAARAPASLPMVRDAVNRGLARLAPSEPMLTEWVGRVLAHLPDGDALCHGDLPGTPPTLTLLATIGRRLLISSYVRSYERNTAKLPNRDRLRHWEIVNLAVRLVDEVPGERPRLLRRLRQEFARTEAS
jgi:hypothetical protein